MKVLFLTEPLVFSFIPRVYPNLVDTLSVTMRNVMSDVLLTPTLTFTVSDKVYITLDSQPSDFKSRNKYEIAITNGTALIYKGECIILDSGTDIQNYEYNTQTNARFDYK
jgi:hypothetical protein